MGMNGKIRQAYDAFTPDEAAKARMRNRLRRSTNTYQEKKADYSSRIPETGSPWGRKAAAAALAVCICAGCAYGAFRMKKPVYPAQMDAPSAATGTTEETVPAETAYLNRILESREYQAAKAWTPFDTPDDRKASYNDPDWTWDGTGIYFVSPDNQNYEVYSPEKEEALADFLKSNNLKRVGSGILGKAGNLETIFGVQGMVRTGGAKTSIESTYGVPGSVVEVTGKSIFADEESTDFRLYWIPDGVLYPQYTLLDTVVEDCSESWIAPNVEDVSALFLLGDEYSAVVSRMDDGTAVLIPEKQQMSRENLMELANSLAFAALQNAKPAEHWQNFLGRVVGGLMIQNAEEMSEMISLAGTANSAEYQAAYDWLMLEDLYDRNREILNRIGNSDTGIGEEYNAYACYSEEMKDTLDQICREYGLKKLTNFRDFSGLEGFQSVTGIYGLLTSGYRGNRNSVKNGYGYNGGTFQIDGSIWLENEEEPLSYQLRRAAKGYFDPVTLNIGSLENYKVWSYKAWDNANVILATDGTHAQIYADFPTGAVTVHFESGGMTRERLEILADCFAFSVFNG